MTVNPRKVDAKNCYLGLTIDNQEIMNTEQIILLGVSVDKNLNFSPHISEICMKAGK